MRKKRLVISMLLIFSMFTYFTVPLMAFAEEIDDNSVTASVSEEEQSVIDSTVIDKNYDNNYQYEEGIIEVPRGTEIEIDEDNNSVTIFNDTVDIHEGDTFVVYLEDLPIGYIAQSVEKTDGRMIVSVIRAQKSIYKYVDEQGEISLTPDMYEFIPAEGVTVLPTDEAVLMDGSISYEDGALRVELSEGGASTQVTLSNLSLWHEFTEYGYMVSLNGDWAIENTLSASQTLLDAPLGEIRIYGVGVIKLSLNMNADANLKALAYGYFRTGIEVDGSIKRIIKEFDGGDFEVHGKGEIAATLKISAGLDILVAAADVYTEIGLRTQYTTKTTYDKDEQKSIRCDDFKYYLFSNVGAEAKYYAFWTGSMETLASTELELIGEDNSPFIRHWHWENEEEVGGCRYDMDPPDLPYGEVLGSIESSGIFDDRVMETDVCLPSDLVISNSMILSNGNLDLNGHILTIEGDFIQKNGNVYINGGILHVTGDYRIQSCEKNDFGDMVYGESDGALHMNSSEDRVIVDGSFITQSKSEDNNFYGTMYVKGDVEQKNTSRTVSNFQQGNWYGEEVYLVMDGKGPQRIYLENPEENVLNLKLQNDVQVTGSASLNYADLNGYHLMIADDLTLNSGGVCNLNGGLLSVGRDLLHGEGEINFVKGTLNVHGDYRCKKKVMNSAGEIVYEEGYGLCRMEYPEDLFIVRGNYYAGNEYYWYYAPCMNGRLELWGDLLFEGVNYWNWPSESSQVISFTAGKEHNVRMNARSTFIPNLEIMDDAQLNWEGYMNVGKLASNGVINNYGMNIVGLNLNEKTLIVNGDTEISDYVNLNKGELVVNGDLRHSDGEIQFIKGKLEVGGNYNIQRMAINEGGDTVYDRSYGWLCMEYPEDQLIVHGDMLVDTYSNFDIQAGVMSLEGDFTQTGDGGAFYFGRYDLSCTHTTVLCKEEGIQKVTFEGSSGFYNGFNVLKLTRDKEYYEFNPEVFWERLLVKEGWRKDNTGWWYQYEDGTYPRGEWKKIDGNWYYFDKNGYRLTGWIKINTTWYYLHEDGVMAIGWLKINSDYYYFNKNGAMAKNTWVGDYYLTSSGRMAKDTWIGDKYVDSTGKWDPTKYKEGWKQDSVGWRYQLENGTYVTNQWKQIKEKWYHFDEDGYMQTGWLKLNNTWYYLKSGGAMVTGWLEIGSSWYYFNSNGSMATDTWIGNYYVDSSGKWQKGKQKVEEGWKQNGIGWWYQNADGTYPKNEWKKIDGKWYHFDEKGYRQTGWLKLDNKWYYFKSDGVMATGWLKIGSYHYYFYSNGSMASDTWIGEYYVNSSGRWVKDAVKE